MVFEIIVLKEATAGHEEGVLVQVKRSGLATNEGFAQREEKAAQLARVSELGGRAPTKGDALLLQRLLSGDVPQPDWKKLNRKATFKMAYKARSFKMLDDLAKAKQTVDMSLSEARYQVEAGCGDCWEAGVGSGDSLLVVCPSRPG